MRILILGGDGMLGHQLLKYLSLRHEVKVTLRQDIAAYTYLGLFNSENSIPNTDVRSYERLVDVFADYRPNVVINAIGIVKQRSDSKESIPSLEINALLPHKLSVLCKILDARLIHLSTDCIFSGKKGNYYENDLSDAEDLYGKTKYLGEVRESNCITIRTSIIGRELSRHTSLLDWFLAQKSSIKGYTNAIYSGFTTIEMSKIIEKILVKYPTVSGVYQVSSDPISKYELLLLIRKKFGHNIEIIPDDIFKCDRSLNSSRFRSEFGYVPPSWNDMVEEL
jgi:dTDP-4-dehydrorhamnose reductase